MNLWNVTANTSLKSTMQANKLNKAHRCNNRFRFRIDSNSIQPFLWVLSWIENRRSLLELSLNWIWSVLNWIWVESKYCEVWVNWVWIGPWTASSRILAKTNQINSFRNLSSHHFLFFEISHACTLWYMFTEIFKVLCQILFRQ